MSVDTVPVGVIGAGVISGVYLDRLTSSEGIEVVAIGDLVPERARERAKAHGIAVGGTPADVLDDPRVRIVVNLTVPAAHAELTLAALERGKHVWSEKPIALDRGDADAIVERAAEAGLRVGVAPDTLLGDAFETSLAAIRDGVIGRPLFAQAAIQNAGPDLWHPAPEFLFARGGGPVLDMGPYYVTALVRIFGPVADVTAVGQRPETSRTVRTGPARGTRFPVEVDSTVSAIVRFENGAHAQLLFSFDSPLRRAGFLEVTGTTATLALPDPNRFDGAPRIIRAGVEEWTALAAPAAPESRGLGVSRLAASLRDGTPTPASAELGRHVLDVLLSIEESAARTERVAVRSTLDVPS
ncbi:MAG: Gfo/Idh/MocA family oxidoreductase [Microbacterium sp.]